MAKQTNLNLRQMTFYQIFPRQYSQEGNFMAIVNDLDRIKKMGVDVIYLTPIHPIGEKARKGSIGSPYAIKDYYQIDENYGTIEVFKKLIDEAHKKNIKIMIDIVINHTSRDSKLVEEHPNWFYKNDQGEFANRVGDWSDITDLDYQNKAVWHYMQDMLSYWAKLVDGFRCDVAPLIPLDFWIETRKIVDEINPELIWLTESVHPGFIKYLRDLGHECHTDSEMYQAFDICYDYDIFDDMDAYLKDANQLDAWIASILRQEVTYPSNYVKLRSFENHDQKRLRSKVKNEAHFMQMLAWMFFMKGSAFIYAGMEHQAIDAPSLFEKDIVKWDKSLSVEDLIGRLAMIKQHHLFRDGHFNVINKKGVIVASYHLNQEKIVGIFNLGSQVEVHVDLHDGMYKNMIDHSDVYINNNKIMLHDKPMILNVKEV